MNKKNITKHFKTVVNQLCKVIFHAGILYHSGSFYVYSLISMGVMKIYLSMDICVITLMENKVKVSLNNRFKFFWCPKDSFSATLGP
jgi:hypothetical protein